MSMAPFSVNRQEAVRQTLGSYCFLLLLLDFLLVFPVCDSCEISEFYCDNRRCVSLDKYCNG